MQLVEPAPHEFSAHFLFAEHGLDPYFAADRRIKAGGGSQRAEFELDGQRWLVKLYYQDSGIVHPGSRTPAGTRFGLDEMREFRLKVNRHPEQDYVGEQGFNAHLAPRWQDIETEDNHGNRNTLPVPDDIDEAVNVHIQGSNIAFERYHELLRKAADAVGINDYYFDDTHEFSTVLDAERYVRLHDDASGPVHARDGPIASMGHLLENDREGYRKIMQNDTDENGRQVPGYYHTVTLGPMRVQAAFPDHTFPREVKHYYAQEADSMPDDHPLSHPKVGASYQRSRWDEKIGVDELGKLREQLDQTVHSVLAEAGIQVHVGDSGPFVEDAYFDPHNVERPDDWLYNLDLTELRQEQESIVVRYLMDNGLTPTQTDALDVLVGDGGDLSPADIADEADRHVESVRRALREIDELVEREYDRVSLRSSFIADLVHDAIKQAQGAIERAVSTGAKAVEAAKRGLDETTSAFMAWAARHGVDVDEDHEARLRLRMDGMSFQEAKRAIRRGYELWTEGGKDPARFRDATVEHGEGGKSAAWRWLDA